VSTPRTQITHALFSLLQQTSWTGPAGKPVTWNSSTLSPSVWGNYQPADQPALLLFRPHEKETDPQAFGATVKELHYTGLIYLRADGYAEGQDSPIIDQIDNILDGLDYSFSSLAPNGQQIPTGSAQTLGGLVQNCCIDDGEIWIDAGILDQQCAIVVPIYVLTGL
jgi:hypothetical protein